LNTIEPLLKRAELFFVLISQQQLDGFLQLGVLMGFDIFFCEQNPDRASSIS